MFKVKCIEKARDKNNNIVGYKIINENGKVTPVRSDELKGAIRSCAAQSIDLRSFDTSNVTDMSYMFCWGSAYSLDLSSFDTSKVTNMRAMFFWM